MKTRFILSVALLAASLACPAEEANPFVKKTDSKAPEAPPGPTFASILEHILVPPEMIDEWTRQHSMSADSTALRAEVGKWVEEGKATLDCTTIVNGVSGRKLSIESIHEQIYPTAYAPGGAGVWPIPTAFETRNLGYTVAFYPELAQGKNRFSVDGDVVEMVGSLPWNPLMEKTRHPDNVFLPIIRTMRLGKHGFGDQSGGEVDPFADPENAFDAKSKRPPATRLPTFEPGKVALLFRMDPPSSERKSGAQSRLTFVRGEFETKEEISPPLPEVYYYSIASVSILHSEFSLWLQGQQPLAAIHGAWPFVETLRKAGRAEWIDAANGRAETSSIGTIQNIEEFVYPTEYEPTNEMTLLQRWEERKSQTVDGKQVDGVATYAKSKIEPIPGLAGASLATAFETRNTGVTFEIEVLPNQRAVIAKLTMEKVEVLGNTVFRRIEDQGNWFPDIPMPHFGTRRTDTTSRLVPGKWTLISSGFGYTSTGKVDREHSLLQFVKVE